MKRVYILIIWLGFFGSAGCELLYAQGEDNLETRLVSILNTGLGQNYFIGYTQPVVNAFGIAMSGGLYHRGYSKQFPHLDVGLVAVYLNVPQKDKVFHFAGEARPTFFSTEQSADTSGISGCGLTEFFLPQIQFNLGLTSNAELLVRGSQYRLKQIGNIRLLGAGIKFGLTDIIPKSLLSLDVSVQALYQTMRVENWLNSATFGMNIQASNNIFNSPLEIYGGLGYEITEFKFDTNKLTGIGTNGLGELSIAGENNLRLNLGLSYIVWIFNMHLDYNMGLNDSIAGGFMLVF
jgi:hypothetical protein